MGLLGVTPQGLCGGLISALRSSVHCFCASRVAYFKYLHYLFSRPPKTNTWPRARWPAPSSLSSCMLHVKDPPPPAHLKEGCITLAFHPSLEICHFTSSCLCNLPPWVAWNFLTSFPLIPLYKRNHTTANPRGIISIIWEFAPVTGH